MNSIRQFRFKVFIALCGGHLFLLLMITQTHLRNQNEQAAHTLMQIVLLKKPTTPPEKNYPPPTKKPTKISQNSVIKAITATISPPQEMQETLAVPESKNDTPTPHLELKKDIKAITQSMKEEFNKHDLKPKKKPFQEFGEALDNASIVNHTGTQIVKRFAYDGRPVSKVITPFGTYCIRHPKPGEKPELIPPALPVSCGRL